MTAFARLDQLGRGNKAERVRMTKINFVNGIQHSPWICQDLRLEIVEIFSVRIRKMQE